MSPDRLRPAPGVTASVQATSVLVLAPHHDDEVLGCGGLIAQLAAAGAAVRVLFLTDGGGGLAEVTPGGDRDVYRRRRREESAAAGAVLGRAGRDYLELPDGALEQHLDQAAAGIRRALLSQRPELLLCPSPLEGSADHRAAFAALHRLLAPWRAGGRSPLGGGEPPGAGSTAVASAGGEPAAASGRESATAAVAASGPAAATSDPAAATSDPQVAASGPEAAAGGSATAAAAATADELLATMRVLLYDVNHPGYPDLLVDVSAMESRLRQAMACYASQEELHSYLEASLGLRRFRTLSLGRGVVLAEAYRQLAVADFTTRSLAQLVRHVGGEPVLLEVREGPRVSVVVRTRDRPELLREALASLAGGEYRRVTVVLVNDGGAPPPVPVDLSLPVVRIDLPVSRGRAAAAAAGIAAAEGDYVAFLDDDDLAAPEHLATLAGMVAGAAVRVAYTDAAVGIYELDGESGWSCRERRLPYSRDFDPDLLLVDNYIPFNTLLIERRLLQEVGPPDPELPFFEDWDLLIRLAALAPFHHLARVTCEYRHFRGPTHHVFGERPRERGDFLDVKARVLAKHAGRLAMPALVRAIDTLRGDQVRDSEALDASRRDLVKVRLALAGRDRAHHELAGERADLEARYHAANGEAHALRQDGERLTAEIVRLGQEAAARDDSAAQQAAELRRVYGEEARLRAAVTEQTAHLARTYGEIERLNGQIRDMAATRAWRIRQWLDRGRR